jgi:hypothetical protein
MTPAERARSDEALARVDRRVQVRTIAFALYRMMPDEMSDTKLELARLTNELLALVEPFTAPADVVPVRPRDPMPANPPSPAASEPDSSDDGARR